MPMICEYCSSVGFCTSDPRCEAVATAAAYLSVARGNGNPVRLVNMLVAAEIPMHEWLNNASLRARVAAALGGELVYEQTGGRGDRQLTYLLGEE